MFVGVWLICHELIPCIVPREPDRNG
jgi:hypothetical protein